MIFLNPTILLGLLAASIPIVLHFLNLRKIKKVEFSTLSFLKELQKSKIRKIKIKQLLLLLLRILIILFLVFSFARPTLESTNIGGIGSTVKTTAIIIVDNSFSMSVVDEKGSFLNQAKAVAKDLISSFQTGDEVNVLITSQKESEQFSTLQTIDDIDVSYITSPLAIKLRAAYDLLSKSNNLNKEVYIFSDFQKSTISQIDSLEQEINFVDTKFYLFQYENDEINNLAATNLQINNQIFELSKEVDVISTVTNFSTVDVNNKLNSLYFNGKRIAQKSISVESKSTINKTFRATTDKTGIIEITSGLEDDDIMFDNNYYNYIMVPDIINVLLVGKFESDFLFIKSALKSNVGTIINFNFVVPKDLLSINLNSFNSLVVAGSDDDVFSEEIKNYVNRGGNLILFPSNKDNLQKNNKLFSSLNISNIQGISKSNDNSSINSFDKIDFNHAIFNGIFGDSNKEIESPSFYKYLKFTSEADGRVIIGLQDNSSFLTEYKLNKGKILFFNVYPNLEWSDFPLKNIFAPLINRSINYLVSNHSKDDELMAGVILSVNISQRKSNQIKVIRPDGSEELINVNSNTDNYLNYSNSNLIGIYKFYSNEILLDIKAININGLESELTPILMDDFARMINNDGNVIVQISSSDDYKGKIATVRYGSELWQLFLIIALLLAFLEMYIARSSKKDLVKL
jgi:Aerotolerance regulator N-terminal